MRLSREEAAERIGRAQKSGNGVPAYLRWVNRPLGRRFAVLAASFGWTANHVTALSALFGVAAVLALCAWRSPLAGPVAALLLLIGYILDSADGQLARIRGEGGPAGEWLDHVVDGVRAPAVHIAVAVHLWREGRPEWLIGSALVFSVVVSAWFLSQLLAEKLSTGRGPAAANGGLVDSLIKQPQDVSTTYVVIACLPFAALFALLYPLLLLWHVVMFAASLSRKHRQLARGAR